MEGEKQSRAEGQPRHFVALGWKDVVFWDKSVCFCTQFHQEADYIGSSRSCSHAFILLTSSRWTRQSAFLRQLVV